MAVPTSYPLAADHSRAPDARLRSLDALWRAANYLGAAQLYLRSNGLLREPLQPKHIKPRLLGHWGTQPGLNLVYAHLNRLIQDTGQAVLYVAGPGHGAPAVLANLYLEGTLGTCDDALGWGAAGVDELVRRFSWPGGHASHVKPDLPGTIHEGGELGYALAHAVGAAFDHPELLVACIVGDGEAETGPTAASWHANKFLSPATDGAVLPILHLNRYKIDGPTVFGRMSRDELERLFTGYGWQPLFVGDPDAAGPPAPMAIHRALWRALDLAHASIREIQQQARDGAPPTPPRWPMLVLSTPKGWTGPAAWQGTPIEGTFRAHQIPIEDPAGDAGRLRAVEDWLRSYRPGELFDADGHPAETVQAALPRPERQMGRTPYANGGTRLQPLDLPAPTDYDVVVPEPGATEAGATRHLGRYLRDVLSRNRRTFRFVCPDETDSNRLDAVLDATDRVFAWPLNAHDEGFAPTGQAVEVLSEHLCEGVLEGYLLTGRHGLFACYEAFVTIIDSMAAQHAKWLKWAREVPWRAPIASLNVLLTSHAWRQDHNGYSHQGPGFINTLLTKKHDVVQVYLPPDANSLLHVAHRCFQSRDGINLIVASKQPMPQWLGAEAARAHVERGASVWAWAGSESDGEADVVLACAGDVPTYETLAAAWLLRRDAPGLRVRVVNVVDLLRLGSGRGQDHGLGEAAFADLFGTDVPVVFAFHGYPRTIHELVYRRPAPTRFHVRGYVEEGSTTTPFDMVVANRLSRYHLAAEALRRADRPDLDAAPLLRRYEDTLDRHHRHIRAHGVELPEVAAWSWAA